MLGQTWLMPWLYLGIIGALYLVGGSRRPAWRAWVVAEKNLWMTLTLVLVGLGLSGVIFWWARWWHVVCWLAGVGLAMWSVRKAIAFAGEETPPGELQNHDDRR